VIIADQKRAVLAWVQSIISTQGLSVPLDRVVWGNQDSMVPRPYCQLLYTGGTKRGNAPEHRGAGGDDARDYWQGTATVSVTFVGPVARTSLDDDADSLATEFAVAVHDFDLGEPLAAAGLAVQTFTELPAQDALTGQSQWETRASVDVTFNAALIYTSSPGSVETVPVTGTTEPPTPIGTFTVSTSP
jgi:hypothetical protein